MALNFPDSPVLNQIYEAEGATFRWNGSLWLNVVISATQFGYTGSKGDSGFTGSTGFIGSRGYIGSTVPTLISNNFANENSKNFINSLRITSAMSTRFAGAYRSRYAGNIVWYFAFSAMTLAPDVFDIDYRKECLATAIDKAVVGNRQNSQPYTQFTLVKFASGKIFFCNIPGTSAASAPSDAGVTTAGSFLGDGSVTWEYTGLQAPAGWEWFILDVDTGLSTLVWPDSNDSYAAMLAAAVDAAKVDASWLNTSSAHPGFTRMAVIEQLIQSNMTDQLTGTSPGPRLSYTFQDATRYDGSAYTIQFLADNVEVWRGYRAQALLRQRLGLSTTVALQNASDIKLGVLSMFSLGRFQAYVGRPNHEGLAKDGI